MINTCDLKLNNKTCVYLNYIVIKGDVTMSMTIIIIVIILVIVYGFYLIKIAENIEDDKIYLANLEMALEEFKHNEDIKLDEQKRIVSNINRIILRLKKRIRISEYFYRGNRLKKSDRKIRELKKEENTNDSILLEKDMTITKKVYNNMQSLVHCPHCNSIKLDVIKEGKQLNTNSEQVLSESLCNILIALHTNKKLLVSCLECDYEWQPESSILY